ncbi:MAG: endonuclease III [Halanaerobiales bacterium]
MEINNINKIIEILSEKYPDPETALNHNSVFELLIATILSAQTTDKQVNKVTANLFKKYNTPEDFANLEIKDLENEIKSIGLYRNKSKYIVQTSQKILNDFKGKIPKTRKRLMQLPGVGRKTANVVLACGFAHNAFPVDTHVFRVARRLGLASSEKTDGVEKELMDRIPEKLWGKMHHWLIFHGRETCKAQNPLCEKCELKNLCKYQHKV